MSNNTRKRRNYDDIDDMNEEERKGRTYLLLFMLRTYERYLFSPLVNELDDNMIPRLSPDHSHDTTPYHLIEYKVAPHHYGIPVASVC